MAPRKGLLFGLALALTWLAAGCGGQAAGAADATAAAALGRLPRPSTLAPHSSTAVVETRHGADFDAAFHGRLTASGAAGNFAPDWEAGNPASQEPAYGAYRFSLPAPGGSVHLLTTWATAPSVYWLGLGNYSADRWEWHYGISDLALPADLTPYQTGGELVIAVVVLGTTSCALTSLEIDVRPAGTNLRKLFFLHHSTGAGLIDGGMRSHITNYNSTHAETFEFWDQGYNGDGVRDQQGNWYETQYLVPDDNTNPDGLNFLWCSSDPAAAAARSGIISDYEVIAFKSCFPASAISDDAMLQQYKDWYKEMRPVFAAHPERLFIVMSTPPLVPLETNAADAARARAFAEWLKSAAYLSGYPNIRCFDLFNELAAPAGSGAEANMLRAEYRDTEDLHNSHPNPTANATVGPVFAQFLIDTALSYTPPG